MAEALSAAKKRQALIREAAVTVLSETGTLTHRAVDKAAGIPAGSVNHYAPTRDKLYRLVIEYIVDVVSEAGQKAYAPLAGIAHPTPEDVVDATLNFMCSLASERPEIAVARTMFVGRSQADDEIRIALRQSRQKHVDFTAEVLRSMGDTADPVSAAMIVAVVDGLVYQQVLLADPPFTRDELHEILTRLYGVRRRPGDAAGQATQSDPPKPDHPPQT